MMKSLFIIVCLVLGVTACSSSTTPETHYYLLTNQHSVGAETSAPYRNYYQLHIELPEYLNKPYLVMQLDQQKIHYSEFNLWAEPLNLMVKKALQFDLNNLVKSKQSTGASSIKQDVTVMINYFHITHQSSVVLSGYYQIQQVDLPFSIEVKLAADGYSHAVKKMRETLQLLAQKIHQDS